MKVDLINLTKNYDEKPVLNSLSLSDDINTLAVIGRSGCGKSTLLRILGGLIEATSGKAMLDNEEVKDSVNFRKKVGFVFQQGGLFKHLTALQNISLPLQKVHGFTKENAEKTALTLINRFGLNSEANKKPLQLSGGQQQRIAIARAVAPRPKMLFLDEPTSALDPEYTTDVLDMINELKSDGIGFIIATHEIGFAIHACEKVVFLNNGNIIEYGESKEVFAFPKTSELKTFLSKLLEWKV